MCTNGNTPTETITSHGGTIGEHPNEHTDGNTIHLHWRMKSTRELFATYGNEYLPRGGYTTVLIPNSALSASVQGTRIHLCVECLQGYREEAAKQRAKEAQKQNRLRLELLQSRRTELAHELAEATLKGDTRRAVNLAGRIAQLEAEGA